MSIWTLLQVFLDLVMVTGCLLMWLRLRRPPQDDPRLSRGLQLLQTKITVLEDLSDRTDAQVKQLTGLLDHKARVVQDKILQAEQQLMKIDHSMNKSMEVAEIFQDKIPHGEILERQRTVEYVKAARMAHSGLGVEEIMQAVNLPREQVELIQKFNREQLMFDEAQLPDWALRETGAAADGPAPAPQFALESMDFSGSADLAPMEKIGQEFKHAVNVVASAAPAPSSALMQTKVSDSLRSSLDSMQPAVMSLKATAQTFKEKLVSTAEDLLRNQPPADTFVRPSPPVVRKVIFPRIEK